MAKNFSVEWLSQSFYSAYVQQGQEVVSNDNDFDDMKTPNSCAVLPRPSASYTDILVEPKASPKTVDLLHAKVDKDNKESTKTPSSPMNSCGDTSDSESEVGEDSEVESGPHRRARTKFTSDQIVRLEKLFNKHKYLGATQRRKTAEKLHLSETQVKTWFQNRRMKLKREVQDIRAEYFAPAMLSPMMFPPAASFQNHRVPGQLPPHSSGPHLLYSHQFEAVPIQHIHQQRQVHPMMFTSSYY